MLANSSRIAGIKFEKVSTTALLRYQKLEYLTALLPRPRSLTLAPPVRTAASRFRATPVFRNAASAPGRCLSSTLAIFAALGVLSAFVLGREAAGERGARSGWLKF